MNKKFGIVLTIVIVLVAFAFLLLPRSAMPPSAATKIDTPSEQ